MTKNKQNFLRNNGTNKIRMSKNKYYENVSRKIKIIRKKNWKAINNILSGQQEKKKSEIKSVAFNNIIYKDSNEMANHLTTTFIRRQ